MLRVEVPLEAKDNKGNISINNDKKIRPLIIKYKMSETRIKVSLKKKQEQIF